VPVWLLTHARVRDELGLRFPDAGDRIVYVEDSAWHRTLWKLGQRLPARLAYLTTGYLSRLSVQRAQRSLARALIALHRIAVVHQPMPVSPKEPSVLYGLGAPLVIGPMNGGMTYPPAWVRSRRDWVARIEGLGRLSARFLNAVFPGKARAAMLLVANERTRQALPRGLSVPVLTLVENGVDLDLWQPAVPAGAMPADPAATTRFVFMGRLVDWKAVDLLVEAFARIATRTQACLTIVGDGPLRAALQSQASALGLLDAAPDVAGKIHFAGWLSQADCAPLLKAHDVLVLPSVWECGGAVVLEAMACAKPVIATAWGGPLDYLDEHCGILVPPTSPAALVSGLADAMAALAADPALRARLGAAGRRRIEAHFDWRAKTARMLEIYASVVGPKPSA